MLDQDDKQRSSDSNPRPRNDEDPGKPAGQPGSICAPVGIRTPNLLIRSQMLYPLSYRRSSPALRKRRADSPRIADLLGADEIRTTPRPDPTERGVP